MNSLLIGILCFAVGSRGQAGWKQAFIGKTCLQTCQGYGLGCDADIQSSITSCTAIKTAFAQAGLTCNDDCDETDDRSSLSGAPFYSKQYSRCLFLPPGTSSNCNTVSNQVAGGYINLCYCGVTAEPTAAPTLPVVTTTVSSNDGCSVFDIDGFLVDCSLEFPALKLEIASVDDSNKEMIAEFAVAQNATNEAVDALDTKVDDGFARIAQEQNDTNDAVTALGIRLDAQVAQREGAQNDTNEDIATLNAKVDTEVNRLDALIDDIQDTFGVMANLRGSQSASGLGDFIQLDQDQDGYVKIHMGSIKIFGVLLIILLICMPVLMVWMSMRCFGSASTYKYAKVGVVSETEAE